MDYSLFYRRQVRGANISSQLPKFDLFVSAFNESERIRFVYDDVVASRKIWLIQPEYVFPPIVLPQGEERVVPESLDEATQVTALLDLIGTLSADARICIDITGFMRHTLCHLIARLAREGVVEFTALYSEPVMYINQENTEFSGLTSGIVRPVRGMSGSANSSQQDFVIIGVGYDHRLVGQFIEAKDGAAIYPIFGFPSLSADMYQQSAIRMADSGDFALENAWIMNRRFAPANDPFATADVVSTLVKEIDGKHPGANIYLAPLATKAQALGFSVFWQLEGRHRPATTLALPQCESYARETSRGLRRTWAFSVELE